MRWLCLAVFALAAFFAAFAAWDVFAGDKAVTATTWLYSAASVSLVLLAVYLWRARVILTTSRIEAGSFRSRSLERHDIAGFRLIPTPGGTRVLVEPHDAAHQRKVEFVAEMIQTDDRLERWIDSLPNLDEDLQ